MGKVLSVLACSNWELIFVEIETVTSCLMYGGKPWPMKMEHELKLCRDDDIDTWLSFETVEEKWQSSENCWDLS